MVQLVKIQFFKLRNLRSFRFYTLIHLLLFILISLIIRSMVIQFNNENLNVTEFFNTEKIWSFLILVGRWLYIIPGLFIINFITADFENRTIRQNVVEGLGRNGYLLGNYLIILFITLYSCVTLAFLAIVMPSKGDFLLAPAVKHTAYFFLQGIFYLSFAMMLPLFIRKSRSASLIFLIFPSILEPMFSWFIDKSFHINLGNYLPFSVIAEISPLPFKVPLIETNPINPHLILALAIFYTLSIFSVSLARLNKIDL